MGKSERTELHNAIIEGKNDVARELVLSEKIDINAQDEQGYTPLHAASKCRRVEVVELLLEKGADTSLLDAWGITALWRALGQSDECNEIIKLLLAHGVDPAMKNLSGVSVLDHVKKIKTHPNRELFEEWL